MEIESIHLSAPDGLRLHALAAGPRISDALPLVCLPGLARTAEDFRELVVAAATEARRPRRAYALDSRGRGLSDRDPNPANYSIPVELADVVAFLDARAIERAVFVGTSRGGILTMALAAVRPRAIAGAVLVDIGPVIEMGGLLRIKSYVGRLPKAANYEEAAELLRAVMGTQFPAFDDATWLLFARRTFREVPGAGLEPRYDPALSHALAAFDPGEPLPAMWTQFDALAPAPVMVVRGEHSDILSRKTLSEMRARRRGLETLEVPGQGHAPLLLDAKTIQPILDFVERCDPSRFD